MDTIGQLAAWTGTSPRMLRHWDALGLLETAAAVSAPLSTPRGQL